MNHCYTVSLSVYLRSTRLSKLCSRRNMSFVAGTTTKAIVSTLAGDYVCLATDFVNTTASLCICARCNYRDRCVVEIKMKGKFDECFPKLIWFTVGVIPLHPIEMCRYLVRFRVCVIVFILW